MRQTQHRKPINIRANTWIELLEARQLLSAAVGISTQPAPAPQPLPPVSGGGTSSAGSYAASSLTLGPDGAIWFTDQDNNAIGRQASDGSITEYPLPTSDAGPDRISRGPDGNLWFVETDAAQIGRITPAGNVSEFAIPNADSDPTAITAGPGGALWFVDVGTNAIGRITTSGKISEFAIDTNTFSLSGSIAAGPDGNLWATGMDDSGNGVLVRVTPSDQVSSISLPDNPNAITLGSDLNLWVASDGAIDRVTPAGKVSSFALPNGDGALQIAQGPDGAMWFGAYGASPMGRVSEDGKVAEFDPPGSGLYDSINDLTTGPGNQISYGADNGGPIISFNPTNALLAGGVAATATAGQSSAVTVASFIDLAPNPSAAFYQASIDWGDGTTSAGTIAANSTGGFDVSGTHTWMIGSSSVTVTITDVRPAASDPGGLAGRSAVAHSTVTSPAPPAQGTGVNVAATAGQFFSGTIATYTGVALNSLSSYSATIDWGDGHVSTGTLTANSQGGVTVSGSNRYARSGSYSVSTTLWPWQYGGVIPVSGGASAGAGHSGPGKVVVVGASAAGSPRVAEPAQPIPEPPVPLPPVPYPGPNAVTSKATIAPGVMDGTGYSLLASSKQPLDNVVATFTLAQPTTDLSHFHAMIIWNDPSTRDWFTLPNPTITNAPITADGAGSFTVIANTTFSQSGLYHYQVLISDDRLGSGDAAIVGAAYGQVIVDTPIRPVPVMGGVSSGGPLGATAAPTSTTPTDPVLREHPVLNVLPIRHNAGAPFVGDVGILTGVAETSTHPTNLQGTINWGDGSATSTATFTRDRKGRIHVRGKHTFTSGGAHTITLSLIQSLTSASTASTNPPIHLPLAQGTAQITGRTRSAAHYRPTPAPVRAIAGQPFQASLGTFSGPALTGGGTFQATVAWGDGSRSAGSVIATDNSDWSVTGSHSYVHKGVHAMRVVVAMASGTARAAVAARWSTKAIVSAI